MSEPYRVILIEPKRWIKKRRKFDTEKEAFAWANAEYERRYPKFDGFMILPDSEANTENIRFQIWG